VSLGSSRRDHEVRTEVLGVPFEIKRVGTDGDLERAVALLQELDGRVDAIGLGGIDVFLYVDEHRYVVRDGERLLTAVRRTPVVDGSGLKNTLEREVVHYLAAHTDLLPPGTKVLMVSAADRFGMARALSEVGCDLIFGDLIFAAGIPHAIRSVEELRRLAHRLLPELVKLPFHLLYPTGKKQEEIDSEKAAKFEPYYREARVIAGDFHLIRRYLPERLDGQVILTNTTTPEDVALLRARGAGHLVTTTPVFGGRTFGTNVLEAVFVALLSKPLHEVTPTDYLTLLHRLQFKPHILPLAGDIDESGQP
jgi:hypothetical protein